MSYESYPTDFWEKADRDYDERRCREIEKRLAEPDAKRQEAAPVAASTIATFEHEMASRPLGQTGDPTSPGSIDGSPNV